MNYGRIVYLVFRNFLIVGAVAVSYILSYNVLRRPSTDVLRQPTKRRSRFVVYFTCLGSTTLIVGLLLSETVGKDNGEWFLATLITCLIPALLGARAALKEDR